MNSNNNVDALSLLFKKIYTGFISDATLNKYVSILDRIQKGNLKIKSKTVYLQTRSAIDKCKKAGIAIDFFLPEWKKHSEDSLKRNRIDKYISLENLKLILGHLPKTQKGREVDVAIRISYFSGCRLSEVLNLKAKDIQISIDNPIRLSIIGKNLKFRVSFLPREMKDDLVLFKAFTIKINYVETIFKRALKKCPLLNYHISFHSLRHSCAKNWIQKGVKLNKIQELLGHANLSTTSIYLKCVEENPEDLIKIGY